MTIFIKLRSIIHHHWTVAPPIKSAAEEEAEQYLVCIPTSINSDKFYYSTNLRFNRLYILVAAFMCQFCLGSLYAWSVYNQYIDDYVTGEATAGKAVKSFYIACGALGLSAALLGPWLEKVGPRRSIATGATLFLLGHIGAGISIAMKSMIGIYFTYGIVAGTGIGICYSSPIAAVQKWFPDLRGTASGVAVCGFGAGPVLWARLLPYPLHSLGAKLYISFPVFGILMSIVLYLCAIIMRTPPSRFRAHGKDMHGIYHDSMNLVEFRSETYRGTSFKMSEDSTVPVQKDGIMLFIPEDLKIPEELPDIPTTEEVVHPHEFYRQCDLDDAELFYFQRVKQLNLVDCLFSIDFLFLWLMFQFTIVFGLIIISRLYDMDIHIFSPDTNNITMQDADRAEKMVSYNAIFNFLGRLIWPTLSDVAIRLMGMNPATGRKLIYIFNLSVQLVVALSLRSAINSQNHDSFQALVWTLTFVYGGGFGTIPCFLCDMFGAFNIGALHGIILTCWSIAGLGGGLVFTDIFDAAVLDNSIRGAYNSAMPFFIIGACIGLAFLLLVRTNPVDRFALGYQFSIGRVQFINTDNESSFHLSNKVTMTFFGQVCSFIQNHWTVTPTEKTPSETKAEKFLICFPIPFTSDSYYYARCISRWYILFGAFLAQFCLGSLYAWSVYNTYIDEYVTGDPNAGKAVLAYYAACGTLGLAAAVLGPWLEKIGPQRGVATGATLFLVGHIGAGVSIAMKSMAGIYISYGVVAATGMGFCYSLPIAVVQKWFPDLRGTASGVAVCGFGAGPVLWARVFPYPMNVWGTKLYISFIGFGVLMSVGLYLSAITMRTPPSGFRIHGKDMHGIGHDSIHLLESDRYTYRSSSMKQRNLTQNEQAVAPATQTSGIILYSAETVQQTQKDGVVLISPEDLNIPVAEETAHAHEFYRECDLDDAELFYFRRIKQLKMVECLFSLDFLFLWIMFLFTAVFGMVMISRLFDMDVSIFSASTTIATPSDTSRAGIMVSYNGIFIFLGCLIWPMLSDLVIRLFNLNPATGRKLTFLVILSIQLVVATFLPSAINSKNHDTFQALVWTLTFAYGGGWGTIPCFLCDMFGAYNIGALNGIILTCGTIAGIGGGLGFTSVFDNAQSTHSVAAAYDKAMPLFGFGVCIGILTLLLVRTNPVDRFAPGYQFSVGRFKLCNFKPKNWQFQDN
ncbi:Major Facilitator Superfamily (MFS) [Thraustotheca clavata]|uniref:Major Facilitator Superfamily (MFS) n=1 Tax=Thraustotheca clavata TaxID=74557 RepID=A0A1W0A7Z2_9STRA|nr:Major Facilitator Superfamily (MFS) [Thraustotheca clavata]